MTSKKTDYFFIFLCAFFLACLAAFAGFSVRVFWALADYRAERAQTIPQDLPKERIGIFEFVERAERGDFPAVFVERDMVASLYAQEGDAVFFAKTLKSDYVAVKGKLEEAGVEITEVKWGAKEFAADLLFELWVFYCWHLLLFVAAFLAGGKWGSPLNFRESRKNSGRGRGG